ncbi:MAG: OmpA family protein [Alphaproteobacteria bacterium]|nr:OmpA family protein [Alphaproteobacteria bacterium]
MKKIFGFAVVCGLGGLLTATPAGAGDTPPVMLSPDAGQDQMVRALTRGWTVPQAPSEGASSETETGAKPMVSRSWRSIRFHDEKPAPQQQAPQQEAAAEQPAEQPAQETQAQTQAQAEAQTQQQAAAPAPSCQEGALALQIAFEFDSYELTPEAIATVAQLAGAMNSAQLSNCSFVIEGHTDALGGAAYNQQLSDKRAKAVRDLLTALKIDQTRLAAIGRGMAEPYDPTKPADGINRRVEFHILPGQ